MMETSELERLEKMFGPMSTIDPSDPRTIEEGLARMNEAAARTIQDNYPPEWPKIAFTVKEEAGWRCERCKHIHEPATGYCLTVHHLDGVKSNCSRWNLAALCQRCHLKIQARVKMNQLFFEDILDVSEWFKPHLEGFLRSLQERAKPVTDPSFNHPPCER